MVWKNPKYNWSFYSESEPFADDRRLFHPRGRVIGGSSSINMMSYVRGHRHDFDRWHEGGATDWNYDNLLSYFKRSEDFEGGSVYRGVGGPLQVTRSNSPDDVYEAFLHAGVDLGYALQEDYNDPVQDGFSRMQILARGGRRSSAASAYLRSAMVRPNLKVLTHALVTRMLLDGTRVIGVEYVRSNELHRASAKREVVLSGGAFCSPQLLMLSGIGPAAQLESLGIKPVHDLPGVGENLKDHPQVNLMFGRRGKSRMRRELRIDRLAMSLLRNSIWGTGFVSEAPGGVTAFVRSGDCQEIPDLQLFCIPSSLSAHPWFPILYPAVSEQIVLKTALLRPRSTGRVTLASANPAAPPRILTNFLADENDRRALREGVRICRRIALSQPFRRFIAEEISPDRSVQTDLEIDAFIRRSVETIFHPCGTCRMGVDARAVVDPNLKVHGIESLRVVDASVMPDHIGATINAAVVAIAERGSDIIRGII
jgi:choline dehydrogenase-like flavoprotein